MTTINQKHLERCVNAARYAGCPSEQTENLLTGGYGPQPKGLEFHALANRCYDEGGPVQVAQAGGRGGGKSHQAVAQAVFDDCVRYPGLKGLYLRSMGKSARESFRDLLERMELLNHYVPTRSILELSNGSRIILGGFRTDSDIAGYLGIEYDFAIIDDAHLITPSRLKMIRGSIRTSKEGWRPRSYLTFNPGGVGHSYLKKTFVTPWRAGKINGTGMVFSLPEDNKMLNPGYLKTLDELEGWLHRAWRLGDFDVASGQFFTNWNYDLHTCDPFPVPANWDVWLALDYGMSHNNAIYVLAEGDGTIYIVGELVERQWLVPQNAGALAALLKRLNIARYRLKVFVAGHDVFTKRGGETESKSISDQWANQGWTLSPAAVDRINGAAEIRRRLGNADAGIAPTLQIFNTCARLIECIPSLEHDPSRPEDVLKVNCDPDDGSGGDDPYDGARYGLMHKFFNYGPAKVTRYI